MSDGGMFDGTWCTEMKICGLVEWSGDLIAELGSSHGVEDDNTNQWFVFAKLP